MKSPKTVRFGGVYYKVEYPEKVKSGKLAGLCDHDKALIRVSSELGMEMQKSTLLHESLHAAAHHIDWKASEETIVKMEKMLMALLRDNPGFIRWLLQKDKEQVTSEC